MLFTPEYLFSSVAAITPAFLAQRGIAVLVLDVDNTLTTHGHPVPAKGVLEWLREMSQAGIQSVILSNNNAKRVEPFAGKLGLPYIADGRKPLCSGYERCLNLLHCRKEEMAAIGDQLFTDILGARRFGIASILVDPIQAEDFWLFKCKRTLENGLLCYYKKQGRSGYDG